MTTKSFWIALLVAITAALIGCGAPAPSNSVVPRDDAATNNPETAVAPDAPSPPPDVPVITADAGSPTPDAATPVDAAVTPDVLAPSDVATPPPVDSGMPPFDPEVCFWLRAGTYQVDGSTMTPTGVTTCSMQPDGTAIVAIGSGFAAAFGCGYGRAICSGTTCYFPRGNEPDRCVWTDVSLASLTEGARRGFTASSPEGTFRVNLFTSPPGR